MSFTPAPLSSGVSEGLVGSIGRTPLIRLRHLSEATGCEILAKAEFMNPGGSVKDRAALSLIEDAERRGALKPGGTIVEGTAGNTGVGLALVGHAKGYRCIFIVPDNLCREKADLLRALGAEVQLVPNKPYDDPRNFQHVARETAASIPLGWWPNQFDNTANADAHYRTTGPEIWEQTGGALTTFVASIGSGGTMSGTGRYLKERHPAIRTVVGDPCGAAMWSWFNQRRLECSGGESHAEGIGQCRVTSNVALAKVDEAHLIQDRVAIEVMYHLLHQEGLYVGVSAGINVATAAKVARRYGPGQTIVTLLCDGGGRYGSKFYNPAWLAEHHLTPASKGLDFLDLLED